MCLNTWEHTMTHDPIHRTSLMYTYGRGGDSNAINRPTQCKHLARNGCNGFVLVESKLYVKSMSSTTCQKETIVQMLVPAWQNVAARFHPPLFLTNYFTYPSSLSPHPFFISTPPPPVSDSDSQQLKTSRLGFAGVYNPGLWSYADHKPARSLECTLYLETTCIALTHELALGSNRRHNFHTCVRQ